MSSSFLPCPISLNAICLHSSRLSPQIWHGGSKYATVGACLGRSWITFSCHSLVPLAQCSDFSFGHPPCWDECSGFILSLIKDYWMPTLCQAQIWRWGPRKQCRGHDKRLYFRPHPVLCISLILFTLSIWVTSTSRNWHIPWNPLPKAVKLV